MTSFADFEQHRLLSRRYFIEVLGASAYAICVAAAIAGETAPAEAQLRVDLPPGAFHTPGYLTHDRDFGTVERGSPIPYEQSDDVLRRIGMTRDTWELEVVPDLATGAKVDNPLQRSTHNALDFAGLMRLAEKHAVRFLKVITCNNLYSPLGMGLWEGVPLREVVWMTKPVSDIRRVIYYGHHNEDPKQMFRGSLPLGRVLEDPPGECPVILAYKLNGEYLSGKRGGPVRMIVPEAYGFKSVKWLQRVILTDMAGANDTYADENNDIDSWLKTFARFMVYPAEVPRGLPVAVSGIAQVGISGLTKVQYWINPHSQPLPMGDPYFTTAPWRDAQILAPPMQWGGGMTEPRMLGSTFGFRDSDGRPEHWPMRNTVAHWAAVIRDVPPGVYDLRCRTLDANGLAQPMPRPLPKSGVNSIDMVSLTVKA